MIGRVLRALGIASVCLAAAIAGALVGRAITSEVLPDVAELSAIADTLVPADATELRTDDLSSSGSGNLILFAPAPPPSAFRGWTTRAGGADEELRRLVTELQDRGWQEIEDEGRSVGLVDGPRTARVHADPPSMVYVSMSHRPGWLLFLPATTAALGVGAVLALVLWLRTRPRPDHVG